MKYIDADKLRTEIERRKGYISVTHFAEEILSFLDYLEEPKNAEDYHKAFDELYGEHIPNLQQSEVDLDREVVEWTGKYAEDCSRNYDIIGLVVKTARHFYELGKNVK